MSNTKKLILIAFATMLVLNLQLTTPLTQGMENGFTIEQLADNIFVPEAYATGGGYCPDMDCYGGDNFCCYIVLSNGRWGICYDDGWPWQ